MSSRKNRTTTQNSTMPSKSVPSKPASNSSQKGKGGFNEDAYKREIARMKDELVKTEDSYNNMIRILEKDASDAKAERDAAECALVEVRKDAKEQIEEANNKAKEILQKVESLEATLEETTKLSDKRAKLLADRTVEISDLAEAKRQVEVKAERFQFLTGILAILSIVLVLALIL